MSYWGDRMSESEFSELKNSQNNIFSNSIAMSVIKPTLRIFDYDKTIEFYVDWLGFKIDSIHVFERGMPKFMQASLRVWGKGSHL
ncbi:hypothetical protein MgSA37_01014 [Mucilaginibacter gotjawali]|uniref:Uncharacterized protein n=2 Tax=Mucilaginibacter gotjawali TaxID=1550579 RepID=A0A110B1C5_9SPHI|nr:hypothetical protein MgSA37_01014 [Mucilaginibacter gotjawali]